MSDLLEQVAKTIYEIACAEVDVEREFQIVAWDKIGEDDRQVYGKMARAGIAAIPRTSPLQWVDVGHGRVKADTPFGNFYAEHSRWGYCFKDYYDEDELSCSSVEEGKAKAQAEWDKRLEPIFSAMMSAALSAGC